MRLITFSIFFCSLLLSQDFYDKKMIDRMDKLYNKIEEVSKYNSLNVARYNNMLLLGHRFYKKRIKGNLEREQKYFHQAVMIKSHVLNIYFKDLHKVSVQTDEDVWLNFGIGWYDNIAMIKGKKLYMYSICYLPRYTHCEVLGQFKKKKEILR